MTEPMTVRQFLESEGVGDWRIVSDGACAFFATASFAQSVRFVQAVGDLPGVEDHRPNIDIRPDGVTVCVVTTTADHYGMSQRDVVVARGISDTARQLGLRSDPAVVQSVLVIPGAPNTATVMPFWQAMLGYERRPDTPDEDLVDPRRRGPAFWFEGMDEPRPGGGGAIHIAVWVPPEEAEARVAAAIAAGGRLVRDDYAPSWWTLADPAGNEADIATAVGRD